MKPTTSHTKAICEYCEAVCAPSETVYQNEQTFCCFGCATLYSVVHDNKELTWSDSDVSIEYKQYDLPEVFDQLVDFQNEKIYKVVLQAPNIHCSSCVHLLEDLPEIHKDIHSSFVNFEQRKITVVACKDFALSALAMLLDKLGYPPQFNVSKKSEEKQQKTQRSLLRKVAVAGFCFGNSMMFSMPHYFGLSLTGEAFFVSLFKYLNVALSVVVLAYPARDYFKTALEAIKRKKTHIDIPIVLGIVAIWGWSLYEILSGIGFGYLDSLAGLIFFLLIGKWYQNQVYSKISFERSLHDFLPLSVRRIEGNNTIWQRVDELQAGDIVSVKSGEVVPVNGTLTKGEGMVDYSFVTGESLPEQVHQNESIFIGGKQLQGAIEITLNEKQDTAKLWSAWKTPKKSVEGGGWIAQVSNYFTPFVIITAIVAFAIWMFIDPSKALFVFSAVLIVACPCALALSTPFTFGSIVRVFGKSALFLKSSDSIEKLSEVNHIVFDKTGTLTETQKVNISAPLNTLDALEMQYIKSITHQSNHPLSSLIDNHLSQIKPIGVDSFTEIEGSGIVAEIDGHQIRLGSELFITKRAVRNETAVYVEVDGDLKAIYTFHNLYKKDLQSLFRRLGKNYKLSILSGDNDGEMEGLRELYPDFEVLSFNNSPLHKKEFIEACRENGDTTLMIGDGLNDQVALNHSDIGLAVAQNVNGFYPSSDGILVAGSFNRLPELLTLSRYSSRVLKSSLAFSVFYNLIGISFAVAGSLTPIVAAILMPLSSITVVGLVTALVSLKSKKLNLI